MNFYNDNDLKICAWLRELINQKLIPDGVVDSRSIELIKPDELKPYSQCHFFAGIGGWPEALRLAGWPADVPVWTGSCPCQPYSCAGKGKGNDDPRNVWPHFRRLIEACHPPVVFGEQVASKAGREWLSGVFADLEALGYSRAGADLCAASVGNPQIRQRIFWLADCVGAGPQIRQQPKAGSRNLCEFREGGKALGQNHKKTPWSEAVWELGHDRKSRRVKPGVCVMANGIQNRVVAISGLGNAIVPQVAAEFIGAYLDINPLPL